MCLVLYISLIFVDAMQCARAKTRFELRAHMYPCFHLLSVKPSVWAFESQTSVAPVVSAVGRASLYW